MTNIKPKVLMLGPGRKNKGGIASVVNQYFEAGLQNHVDLRYISTACDGNKVKKYIEFVIGIAKFFLALGTADIVHIHMASRGSYRRKRKFVRWAKKHNKKVVLHLHGGEFKVFYEQEADKNLKADIRNTFNQADIIIALSEEWKSFVATLINSNKITVVHNAVALNDKVNLESKNIVFLGKLGAQKGVYDLIDAMPDIKKCFPDAKLFFAGDGEIKQCMQRATENGVADSIEFLGWINNIKKTEMLKKCSAFVLPSYNEGLPMSMLEAMSFGIPVVVSNVGGIPAVIRNGENGMMVKPGDVEEIKNTINYLFNNPDEMKRIGRSGYETVQNEFCITKQIDILTKIYYEM